MHLKLSGLWLHSEFRKLWAGQASSLLATEVMFFALALVSAIALEATPVQLGIVTALTGAPAILGLYFGSWVDRRRKLPVVVAADFARAALMATIPITHALGVLTIEVVYAVAFGLATMTILFQIGYRSLLPFIVERPQLTEANSKLEFATSSAGVAAPAGTGLLVQWLTAPFTMAVGSVLYLVSALFFLSIKSEEPEPSRDRTDEGSTMEGLRHFWHQKPLVGVASSSFMFAVFGTTFEVVGVLYMIRELGINPGTLGVMFTIASAGLFIGSFISSRYASKIGIGRATTFGMIAVGIGLFGMPAAFGPLPLVIAVLAITGIITRAGLILFNVGGVTIRQSITPDAFQARMTSINVVIARAGIPVGGLLGGFSGEEIGLRTTLFLASGGMIAASGLLVIFRTWSVRLPAPDQVAQEPEPAPA